MTDYVAGSGGSFKFDGLVLNIVDHFSTRTGLTGQDLNRRWLDPNPDFHPEIFHAKGLINYIKEVLQSEIYFFCDIHGHSRKKNVFIYGCDGGKSWLRSDRLNGNPGKSSENHFISVSSIDYMISFNNRRSKYRLFRCHMFLT